jgi:hypothetical protein
MNPLYPDAPVVSEMTLHVLRVEIVGARRQAGSPLITVTTYGYDRASFMLWNPDGTPDIETPIASPEEVLDTIRALRRTAQDSPDRFVCLLRHHSDLESGLDRLVLVA